MKKDLELISGDWKDKNFPKEKEYYFRYFNNSKVQDTFLRYVFTFRKWTNFVDHTGVSLSNRYCRTLYRRFQTLERIHQQMLDEPDLELRLKLQSQLHSGEYDLGVK